MALVMNATAKEVQVKVHGNWFTFKPKQIKVMDDEKVFFLTSTNAYLGFVSLPQSLEDIDYRSSKEGQALLTDAEKRGVEQRVAHLESLKHNELVSLQRDLDQRNLKYDARVDMSKEMIQNLEELASYKKKSKNEEAEKVQAIKKLEAALED